MSTTERDPHAGLKPGAELAGRYRLERVLGEGGMGVVWEARQITTDKAVAIKILKGGDGADAARFLREARVAAALQHRNIVQVFDFWEVEASGLVFMVMELLRGETLASLLARAGRLPVGDALSVLLPVASALRAAHEQGVVHRDLKPENVFLARVGSEDSFDVKVLDFGLAKPMASTTQSTALTQTGSVMGTPFYMAPEQVYGEKDIDARADIWSFGVLVYEVLTGVRPFTGENYGQVFRQISSGTYRPMRDALPDVPASLEALVARMLMHERTARPQSLAEVERELREAPHTIPGVALAPTQFATIRLASSSPPPGTVPVGPPPVMTPNGTAVVPAHTPRGGAAAPPAAATMLGAATSVAPPPARSGPSKTLVAIAAVLMLGGVTVGTFIFFAAFKPAQKMSTPSMGTEITIPSPSLPAIPSSPVPVPVPVPASSGVLRDAPDAPDAAVAATSAAPPNEKPRGREKPSPRAPSKDPLGGGRF